MKKQIAGIICIASLSLAITPLVKSQTLPIEIQIDQERVKAVQRLQIVNDGVHSSFTYLPAGAVYAQPMFGGLSSDPNHLIHNPQVRKDLELDQDQIKELAEIQKDFQRQIQDGMKQAQNGKKFDSKKWNETYQQLNKDRKAALGAVLLPHQSKRLSQISTQMKMKNQGDAKTLIGKDMAEELGIDDEQKKQLQKRAAEIKAELEADYAKLKEKARQKLLRELRPDQRDKLKDMMGDKFEHKAPKRGSRK